MKRSYFRRVGALLLSVMLCMVFTLASIQEADAASSKTFYVPAKVVITEKKSSTTNGRTEKDTVVTTKTINYDKNGLVTSIVDKTGSSSWKRVYKRNKNGYVVQRTNYGNNKKTGKVVNTYNKNGDLSKVTYFNESGKVYTTYKYEYRKKGVLKKQTCIDKESGNILIWTFDKKNHLTSDTYKSGSDISKTTYKYKFDKKGNPVKEVTSTISTYDGETSESTETITHKYTYDKKGRITKYASVTKRSDDGYSSKRTATTTRKYNSKGDVTKETSINKTEDPDGYKATYKSTYTYKYIYKKVKVKKKYWKFVNESRDSFMI